MATVFIAGSMKIKRLDKNVRERIDKIIESNLDVVIGDADGVDTSIQEYLSEHGLRNAVVYCAGSRPRNNVGDWPVHVVETKSTPGTRSFYTAKDLEMADAADYGLMVWDARSTGTLSNVIELLKRKKKVVVYVNKEKVFLNLSGAQHVELLVSHMSDDARKKAEDKLALSARIEQLRHVQSRLFV